MKQPASALVKDLLSWGLAREQIAVELRVGVETVDRWRRATYTPRPICRRALEKLHRRVAKKETDPRD